MAFEQETADELTVKRVRLLASLTLLGGAGFVLALPFALREGAEFFLPVTAAMVVAIALVPLLEWFERKGLRSGLAALLSVIFFLGAVATAFALIIYPALNWVTLVPERIGRVRATLAPLIELYSSVQKFIDRTLSQIVTESDRISTVRVADENNIASMVTANAPHLAVQLFFALLVVYFFLAGWTAMRRRTIVSRGSFQGAMTTARVIQQVVEATSTYIGTISAINLALGLVTGLLLWLLGMETPLMWGGIVAIFNYVPYLGPIAAALLLGLGGLMSFTDPWMALLPPLIFTALHMIEANVVTPTIVGQRLTISPLLILLSLSYWAWVWGALGALLAVPILIILTTIFTAAGTPDIAGFLFEQGTLTHVGEDDDEPDEPDEPDRDGPER